MLLPETLTEVHRRHRADFLLQPQLRTMGQGLSLSARRRDGSVFPVEVSLAPDTSGTEFTVIAAVRDVTTQREIEARAVETESRLRQVTESVETIFVLIELSTSRYLYLSSGFEKLFGSEPRDLMGSQSLMEDLLHPEDRDLWQANRAAMSRGEAVQAQYRIRRGDGEQRWLRVSSTPVENPQGPVTRTVITIEDVTSHVEASEALRQAETAARKAEAEARSANEAKNQFLSRMSHELRTPLNAVLGFGQLLQRRLADTDNADAIRHILKGGRHLLDLINDVLDIARIESGEMSLSTESVALAELVDETIDLLRPLATDAGVSLHADGGPAEDHVLADRQRLRQILLNLLSNAIKYNHTDGDVWVGWQASDGHVAVTVRDNGQGIAPEHHDRLFTPFDRLGAEGSGVEGTGIGLALTRALAEMMGGSITRRVRPGSGIDIHGDAGRRSRRRRPARRFGRPGHRHQRGRFGRARRRRCSTSRTTRRTCVVVEELLKFRPEWRLVHAATGSLGIDLALSQPPDLILLDLHLPDLSGRDVLIELKRRAGTSWREGRHPDRRRPCRALAPAQSWPAPPAISPSRSTSTTCLRIWTRSVKAKGLKR